MVLPANNRILVLDVCRGFMLFVMTFNHLVAFPFIGATALYNYTMDAAYGKFGLISNSEGFFFIAGITAGIVYGRLLLQKRDLEVWSRISKRIKQMYGIYAVLMAGFAMFAAFNHEYHANWKMLHTMIWVWIDQPGIHYFLDHPLNGFAMGLAFLYQPPFFDLFATYIFLFALTPFLLNQLKKERTAYLLIASIICYIAAQYDPGILERILLTYLPVKLSWFHLGAIQILFVMGLILGFLFVKGRLPNLHKVFVGAIALLLGIAGWLFISGIDIQNAPHLGLLRLSLFCLKAYAVFLARHWITFKPLALLGRHSLVVFTYHIVLTFLLVFFLSEITALPLALKYFILATSIATIWIPAYLQEHMRKRAKRIAIVE